MTTSAQAQVMVSHMGTNTVILPGAPNIDSLKGGSVIMGGDMRSVATPSWWSGNNQAATQTYWSWLLPWNIIWDVQGHVDGLNVRAAIRDQEMWVLFDTGPWVRLDYSQAPAGDSFERSYTGGPFGSATTRYESDGSVSTKISPTGGIYHGYGNIIAIGAPGTVVAIHTRCLARKITENPALPDQRDSARYAVQMGSDSLPNATGNQQAASATYWPGAMSSRFVELSNEWEPIYSTTLISARSVDNSVARNSRQTITDAAFLLNPPPVDGWLPNTTTQPPVIVPTPTVQYIEAIGDSLTQGNESVTPGYRTWRGQFQTLLSAAAVPFDMIGPRSDTPVNGGSDPDHAAWGGASIDSTGNASNNIYDRLGTIFAAQYQPTIVILYIGINDRTSTSASRYETLYNQIRTLRPNAKVCLCTIAPQQGETEAQTNVSLAYYADINTKARDLAAANSTTTTYADLAKAPLVAGDYYDIWHYNPTGGAKIAQVIFDALLAKSWIGTTTEPPVVTPPPGLPLIPKWFDRDDGAGAYAWVGVVSAGDGGTTGSVTQDDDMQTIKQSEVTAARRRIYFDCLDATDGYTPETGLTFAAGELKLSKAGAAEANHAGSVTEIGGGTYMYEATATEVNTLGVLQFRVVKTGVRGYRSRIQITGIDVHDGAAAGLTNLSVSTGSLLTTAGYVNPLTAADGIETGYTLQGALRYLLAAHAKRSGVGGTTEVYRSITDSKARITLTVDASGNVTNVVTDLT